MWKIYAKKADFNEIAKKFNISPIVARVLVNRNIKDEDSIRLFLNGKLEDINDEKLLPDMKKACEVIYNAVIKNKHIRIVGDYDIDGVCATYILIDALKRLNAKVSYSIPDRIKDGYGINKNIIDKAIEDKVNTIITCDNGISAVEEIKYASQNGIEVVITDHHDVLEIPSFAKAVIDPKRNDSEYPFTGICGAVVSLKFVVELYKYFEEKNEAVKNNTINSKNVFYHYLEFATLATVGDLMPLLNENHIIVKEGLDKINHRINRPINKGFEKIIEVQSLNNKQVNEYHLGFILGPLINASGRLMNADIALNLFLTEDEEERKKCAYELKQLNDERKKITEDNAKICIELCDTEYKNDKVLVLYRPSLHESVAGIVAGRVKEAFYKPTLVLTDASDENVVKGSARSIDAYDMFSELTKINDIFIKYGGHKGAAGFSLEKEKVNELRERLNQNTTLTENDLQKIVWVDSLLPFEYINMKLIEDLNLLKPYGSSTTFFPAPLFGMKNVKVSNIKVYGEHKNVIKMNLMENLISLPAVYFGDALEFGTPQAVNILFTPVINEFNGSKNIEIQIKEYEII